MILIVASNKDVASLNIKRHILEHYDFEKTTEESQKTLTFIAEISSNPVKLVTLDEESIFAQNLPGFFADLKLIVFISRHSSLSQTPTLSVHTPGNLGEAEKGGIPRKVSISPANAMRDALRAMMKLKEKMQLDYEVSYEGTHHGPSLDVPTMFTELGSSPKQWNDMKAAEAVAYATMEAISRFNRDPPAKTVLGIGGPHYSSKFTKMALEKEMAFGHMIPKYAVSNLNSEILEQCIDRTLEKVESAVLDWKGIKGEDKQPLLRMLAAADLPFEKTHR
jgi:D-aminoacyl-tRNA deacylase